MIGIFKFLLLLKIKFHTNESSRIPREINFKKLWCAIQEGIVVDNPSDALKAADELQKETGTDWFVVKAQIHAGVEVRYHY